MNWSITTNNLTATTEHQSERQPSTVGLIPEPGRASSMGREMRRQSLGQGLFLIGCTGSGERDTPRLRDLDGRDNMRFVAKNNEEFEPHRVWTLQLKRVKQPDMGK